MAIKAELQVIQSGVNALSKTTASGARVADAASKLGGAVSGQISKVTAVGAGVVAAGAAGVSVYNDIKSGLDMITSGGGIGGAITNLVPASGSGNSIGGGMGSLTYPKTLETVALNPAHINFQFYDRDTPNRLTSINLPMPNTVNNPNTISWDGQDFGMIGDAVVKSLSNMKGGTGSAEKIKGHLDSMAERMKSVAFYSGMSELVQKAGGNNLSAENIMGAVNGKALNPYKTMLFRGVDFRSFNFVFDLVPFEESDCDLIYKIITAFRAHSYPDYSADKMFFTYPDECQITYMWESGANKWLNNFKRAVCTKVEVDYTPMGQWSSIRNGFPNIIRLSTTWTEVYIVSKQDILNKDDRGQKS